jgi:hypothetical protein
MDIELITLVNSFRNTIALNNLLIKEKIIRKLEMIHTMYWYGFPLMNYSQSTNNKILQELHRIDKEGDIVKYSRATNDTETNKLLGDILHNAYRGSGYNVVLSNAPINGTTIEGDFIQLDSQAIYDTLIQYSPADAVISVCQISADTYLVKMASKENAVELCKLLNEKLLEGRIIKVEYIESLPDGIKLVRNKEQSGIIGAVDGIDGIDSIDSIDYIPQDFNVRKGNYFALFLDVIYGFLHYIKVSLNLYKRL